MDKNLDFIIDMTTNELIVDTYSNKGTVPIHIDGSYKVHISTNRVNDLLLSKTVILEFYEPETTKLETNDDSLSEIRAQALSQLSNLLITGNDAIKMTDYLGPNTMTGKGNNIYVRFDLPSFYNVAIESKRNEFFLNQRL